MKNKKIIKSEKGAITILVLIAVLFFVSFLLSGYMLVSNKIKGQKEIIEQTKKIYESETAENAYNSFFNNDNYIPIYTVEQLLKIGSDDFVSINEKNGKIYKFSNGATYILMNDLELKVNDLNQIIEEKDNEKNFIWKQVNNFIGNNKKIVIINNDEKREYNEQNNYEVEYVENKENSYVDTGVKFNSTSQKIEIKMYIPQKEDGDDCTIFGMRENDDKNAFYLTYNGLIVGDESGYIVEQGDFYGNDVTITFTGNKLNYNGTEKDIAKTCTNTELNLFLYALNENNITCNYMKSGTKIYYCKIWDISGESEILSHYIRPIIGEDNEICFYDEVENRTIELITKAT